MMQSQASSSLNTSPQADLWQEWTELEIGASSLFRIQNIASIFWRTSDARTFVTDAAYILDYKAPLIRRLNNVLAVAASSLSVVEENPQSSSSPFLVMLITQGGGEILHFPPLPNGDTVYMTTSSLRATIDSAEFNQQVQQLSSPFARCVMDLLILELKLPLSPTQRRTYNRCLRHLTNKHGVLPASFLIHNVQKDGDFPVACGGFADIYKGRLRTSPVCLKVLRYFSNATATERQKLVKLFCREALAWKGLDHPNILPFIGIAADLFQPSFCLISPWMSNGNIMTVLDRNPNFDRLQAITEIAEAIKYLHGHDPPVVHADIRGANVLITDDFHCCLSDFGLTSVSDSQSSSMASYGSIRWMAPEYINSDAPPSNLPPKDIYAFGCTMLEIYTGKRPFHYHRVDAAIVREVLLGKHPRREGFIPDTIWSLIEACWQYSPDTRPSADIIVNHLLSVNPSSNALVKPRSSPSSNGPVINPSSPDPPAEAESNSSMSQNGTLLPNGRPWPWPYYLPSSYPVSPPS